MVKRLAEFLERSEQVVEVCLVEVKGSSPREAGTVMYVAEGGLFGTIGGGQLEYMAIDEARAMLGRGMASGEMDVPLGPEIGQCCGGRVRLSLTVMTADDKARAMARDEAEAQARPHVYVLGAGHVGRALADLFQHLPYACFLVDTRAEELSLSEARVARRLTALPEAEIAAAPSGSAFIVLTHDHALDFLLASAALERGDAGYVGMIGSATKRARFESWCRAECDGLSAAALVCPIGAGGSADKRPAVIAAQVVAEVITAFEAQDVKACARV